ncbi:uncharacterized protein V3H82_013070 [Fundulus diaphanus]
MFCGGIMGPIIFLTVVGQVSSSSAVQERRTFSCCDNTVSHFHDLSCDNFWIADGTNIAIFSAETSSCEPPCKEIRQDRMVLDQCVNVTRETECTVMGVTQETRVTYLAQTCLLPVYSRTPAGSQSSVGLLLVAIMTGWLLCYSQCDQPSRC